MKQMCKAFAKKLFGVNYEGLKKSLAIELIVFWGLHIADWRLFIAPSVLYLMISTFTAGVMWQALSSQDHAAALRNLFMIPFDSRKFVASYVGMLGVHTIVTKTAVLMAVVLAVSHATTAELFGSVFCAIHAALVAAAAYSLKQYWYVGALWTAAVPAVLLSGGRWPWLLLSLPISGMLAAMLLWRADGYSFYRWEGETHRAVKGHTGHSVWRYFVRYLMYHKNYCVNTVVMWGVACILPLFLRQMGGLPAVPIGFALLSLNTPVCILLSCDPALERAVRLLPGQGKAFCVPYCLFVFACNMVADGIFLCGLYLWEGGVSIATVAEAAFFALQSAIGSAWLEWFYPIRGWKIESDLWHHPRKYAVPAVMLLLAGAVGAWPALLPVLIVCLAAEVGIVFFGLKDSGRYVMM